ncbi:MAG: hypothetical protein RLZZ292_2580 [Bacteroidota bacterium]|jgi:hypothetical protein
MKLYLKDILTFVKKQPPRRLFNATKVLFRLIPSQA